MARISSHLHGDERGTTAVEFALVAPILIALVTLTLDAGRYIWFDAAVAHAARATARCAGLSHGGCSRPEALAREAEAALARLGVTLSLGPESLLLSPAACGREIRLSIRYRPLMIGIGAPLPPLEARACVPV